MNDATANVERKDFVRRTVGAYKFEVQDYGYKNRTPIGVRVSGLTLGECRNHINEPCYFYKSADACSITEGIEVALQIIQRQQELRQDQEALGI